jgi:hypothetical protein
LKGKIMALKKTVVVDQIEVTENGVVQVRAATKIVEDGAVISAAYHRHTIAPGQGYSTEDPKVQAICAASHTAEVIAAYATKMNALANMGA